MIFEEIPDLKRDVTLSGYSTFSVGGPADFFVDVREVSLLPDILDAAREANIPTFILGGGSNVLFKDEGFRGLIIRLLADSIEIDGERMTIEAGARWPAIHRAAAEAQLTGLEAFQGLPGTMGGAVAGNAGCFGTETADVLESARIYDPESGEVLTWTCDDFDYRYRWSRLKEQPGVVLSATLKLATLQADTPEHDMDSQRARLMKQPPGRSSGSFFKNPSSEQPAGMLIDQCGLKGLKIGGAQISPKHGNFFMNMGGATAADLLALRDRAVAAVQEKFGLTLKEEVVIVG